ncbi:MAG: hypothetical protein O2816_12940 [Planctomycetota bacterium]|nr:hypothetical protein [Planctomycetota bacterium]
MSSLQGDPRTDVWTLPGSMDALASAARRAGRPGIRWLGGMAYQVVALGWFTGAVVAGPVLQGSLMDPGFFRNLARVEWRWLPGLEDLIVHVRHNPASGLILIPIALVLFRLVAGLAKETLSDPDPSDPTLDLRARKSLRRGPGLRRLWRQGEGLTFSSAALWVQFLLMMFGATFLFIGPAQLFVRFAYLDDLGAVTAIISGVLLGLLVLYSFLLSILFQIALHSLAANQRGVGSALLHAWRIARNDPMAAARAAMADAVLTFTVLAIQIGVAVVEALVRVPEAIQWLPLVALLGFLGLARCFFWGRVYRTLGGLSTLDPDVPGGLERPPTGRASA